MCVCVCVCVCARARACARACLCACMQGRAPACVLNTQTCIQQLHAYRANVAKRDVERMEDSGVLSSWEGPQRWGRGSGDGRRLGRGGGGVEMSCKRHELGEEKGREGVETSFCLAISCVLFSYLDEE